MLDSMIANFLVITVRPEQRKAFVAETVLEAQGVISEDPGVFEFHVMADERDPNRFYIYEVFRDKAAHREHRQSDVYRSWRCKIEPMLEGNVETVAKMHSIFPTRKGFEAQKPGLLQW